MSKYIGYEVRYKRGNHLSGICPSLNCLEDAMYNAVQAMADCRGIERVEIWCLHRWYKTLDMLFLKQDGKWRQQHYQRIRRPTVIPYKNWQ